MDMELEIALEKSSYSNTVRANDELYKTTFSNHNRRDSQSSFYSQ